MSTSDIMLGGNLRWTSIPSRGVATLLVTSCWDKLWQLWASRLVKTLPYLRGQWVGLHVPLAVNFLSAGVALTVHRYPFVLWVERYGESKVPCPRTQHSDTSQCLDPDRLIQSPMMIPFTPKSGQH